MSALGQMKQVSSSSFLSEAETCFICLMEGTEERPLRRPCKCPRSVHSECLARWQVHQAGRTEERFCRFCNEALPAWKDSLLGDEDDDLVEELHRGPLIAAVVFNNVVYKIPINPGPEGKAEFKQKVHQLFGLGIGSRYECTFDLKLKDDKLSLRGLDTYEAATRCAARSALRQQQQQLSTAAAAAGGEEGASGGMAGGSSALRPVSL